MFFKEREYSQQQLLDPYLSPFTESPIQREVAAKIEPLITKEILNLIPQQDISAILLGGGYGRGEGGILIEDKKEYLYNDYDLFVVLKNINLLKKKDYQSRIHLIHEKFTPLFKIDVDVGPLQTVDSISNAPHWMMWYELKNGHKVLWGNESVKKYFLLTCLP